jgi:hypothetical protein
MRKETFFWPVVAVAIVAVTFSLGMTAFAVGVAVQKPKPEPAGSQETTLFMQRFFRLRQGQTVAEVQRELGSAGEVIYAKGSSHGFFFGNNDNDNGCLLAFENGRLVGKRIFVPLAVQNELQRDSR